MTFTRLQQKKVEENIGLVDAVIRDKVHGPYQLGIFTRDDLYQIGCVGLCKAAVTDKGGTFSTYAYRLIWNEICDALIYAGRRAKREFLEDESIWYQVPDDKKSPEFKMDLETIIESAYDEAPDSTKKGIKAICLMQEGYSCKDIGKKLDAPANHVTAWVSKARKYLKERPEFKELLYSGYGENV